MSSIGTAYVNIVPKAEGIKGTLTKQFSAGGDAAGVVAGKSIVGKMTGIIAGAAIGATIVAGIKKSIGEGAALEQSIGGIETLFKGSADAVIANAKQAFQTAGVSANQYMENVTSFAAGLIQSMGGDTQAAVKVADTAMVDMSDNANKMGTDMAMIQNAYQGFAKQNYTMLDNLKLGYGGTRTEMERLLEDAGKLSGQEYDISNLSDVYNAIHVIQNELGITGTTAQEAASTLSGSFGSMKAAFSDFMGNLALGRDIESSMANLVSATETFLVNNLIPAIGRVFMSLPSAMQAAVNTDAVKAIPDMIDNLASNFEKYAPVIAEEGAKLAIKLGAGLIKGLPQIISIMGKIVNGILKIIVGLPALLLAKGVAAAGKFGLGLLKGFNSALGKVKDAIDKFTAPVKNAVDKIKGFFPLSIGKIFSSFKLPHLSVSGGKAPFGIGGAGSLPKFSVAWYAKGGLLTKGATLFGGGEAGDEAILPLDPFWKKLDNIAHGGNTFNISMTVNGLDNPEDWATRFSRQLELQMRSV